MKDDRKTTEKQKMQKKTIDEKVNKRRYVAAAAVSSLAVGVSGFVIMALAFMLAVSRTNAANRGGMLYIALGMALLVVFLINYFINKIIYFYFNTFSPLPMKYMLYSNIAGWFVLILVYVLMSLG